MSRHVFAAADAPQMRRQVSFTRRDLLLDEVAVHPRTGEVVHLPVPARGLGGMETGARIGPSIAHALVRRVVRTDALPRAMAREAEEANGGRMPEYAAVWHLLDTADLWRREEPSPPREPTLAGDDRGPEHPFRPDLVTGGTPDPRRAAPSGWMPVRKTTTAWVSDGAFRLAAAMHGSADRGAERIGELAAAAWERDVDRCGELHAAVEAAGTDGLLETEDVLLLRPSSSVSQEVEKLILDEALRWLGVDPSEQLRRTPGRRRRPGDDGDIILVDIDAQGRVHGRMRRDHGGWPSGTELTAIPLPRLVELLGLLRTGRHLSDADLLEAYLDAAHPAWRDVAVDEPADAGTTASDAWEVLGLSPGASRDEVTAAYRAIMKKVHPDVAGLPAWVSRTVADAYRTLKEDA